MNTDHIAGIAIGVGLTSSVATTVGLNTKVGLIAMGGIYIVAMIERARRGEPIL
jgi:hypothetical protein